MNTLYMLKRSNNLFLALISICQQRFYTPKMFENNNFYALNTVTTTGSVEDNRDPITSKITVQLVEGETGKKEVHRTDTTHLAIASKTLRTHRNIMCCIWHKNQPTYV